MQSGDDGLFIVASFIKLWWFPLEKTAVPVTRNWLLSLKTFLSGILICLQVVQLILFSIKAIPCRELAVVASSVSLVAAICVIALIFIEHRRSIHPSLYLGGYLFLSILLDIPKTRSLFLRDSRSFRPLASVFSSSILVKVCLLMLEEMPKISVVNEMRKNVSAESISGAMNRCVFWWLNNVLFLGYRRLIELADLGVIQSKFDSSALLARVDKRWRTVDQTWRHGLFWATMQAMLFELFVAVPPRLALTGFKFAQPFLIKRVIEFVSVSVTSSFDTDIAHGLVGATALVYVGIAISTCIYMHLTFQFVTSVRGALVGQIFTKTISLASYTDAAPITLMSTDIDGVVMGLHFIHHIWSSIIEIAIGLYLLYREIKTPFFLVFIPIIASMVVSETVSVRIIPAKKVWNLRVEKRVSATSAMLGQMKGIKAMGLTPAFFNRIQGLRHIEIKKSQRYRIFMISLHVLDSVVTLITPAIIITAAVYWKNSRNSQGLSISQAFTSLTIVALVSAPLAELVAIRAQFNSALSCFQRIQSFLVLVEKQNYIALSLQSNIITNINPADVGTEKEREVAGYARDKRTEKSLGTPTLVDQAVVKIDKALFRSRDGTELLKDIDLKVLHSTIHAIVGPVGSGKTSMLLAILGELNLERGSTWIQPGPIAFCSQKPWLRNISMQENIIAGAEFETKRYNRVVSACALDQDFVSTPGWDTTPVGSQALVLSGGQKQRVALARAIYSGNKILLLDDVFSGLDNRTSNFIFSQVFGQKGLLRTPGYTVILTTSSYKFLPFVDTITAVDCGRVVPVPFNLQGLKESVMDSEYNDKIVREAIEPAPSGEAAANVTQATRSIISTADNQDLTRQAGDSSLYKMYFESVGWATTFIFLGLVIVEACISKMPQIWIRLWTERGLTSETTLYYPIYIGFSIAGPLATASVASFFTLRFIPRSASQLHLMLLETVMKAPLQFFGSTDSGVTLNRFSQDMTLVDQQLPMVFFGTILIFTGCLISGGIIASGGQYTAVSIPFIVLVLYLLQKFYLRTSRQIRHLDLEAKSPLYTHFTETLAGGSTIRAFGFGSRALNINHSLLNDSQRPFYLLFCIQRWLNLVLDLVVAAIAVVMVAIALLIPGASTSGSIALSLFTLVTFSSELKTLITAWTMLETSLGAIARLKSFIADTPDENKDVELQEVSADWPALGAVKLENVVASYQEHLEPSLKGVSLDIDPGTKVAFCGRTGSGKSSSILALLRLIELKSGILYVDGIDLSTVPRQAIRSAITALPQDPVILPGSIRENMDLESRYTADDGALTVALQKVQLWDAVRESGGLDVEFVESSFSVGQQQLVCLARCLLNHGKVILLDEATSSVDHTTEILVREVLKCEFADCTVIEVLHRLDTIMDYDKVVVMQDGAVAEVGRPADLLQSTESLFRQIWDAQNVVLT